MAGRMEGTAWKVIGMAGAIGAGIVAKKLITAIWKKAVGGAPPTNPESPDVQWGEAIGWAVASGAVVGVARMLMSRQLARGWRKATGHLPPGTKEVS